ncbi:MAG: methyltransferase domain-containing protein, partial [Halieaceae bacterium]|nr:methyltransferase domain-containing protein [Halieaceae bacterium]
GEAVTFEVIDALSLPFEEDTIDAIVCQFGVMFYPDKQQAYREALRVLKPGGVFLFNAWGSLDANPFARLAHEVGEDFFPDDAPTFYKVPFGYHAPETGLGELRIAGFSDVSAEIVAIDKQVVSWEDFSIGLVFGNPLAEEIRNRGGVEPETVRLAVAEALANHFGDAPTTMPLEAVVFTARKDH